MDVVTKPLVSVVVPSFNQAEYLHECLSSLVGQTYDALQIIVMDGGSDDGSVSVIQEFEHRIAYWQSQPDEGQTAAIAAGFGKATGEILGWLNSDDVLLPDAIDKVARVFMRDHDTLWVFGHSHIIDRDSRLLVKRSTVPVDIYDLVNLGYYIPQESTFFRKSLYEEVGGLNFRRHYAMDYDLWLRFAAKSPPTHIDEFIGGFRYVSGQKSSDTREYREEEWNSKRDYAEFQLPFWRVAPRLIRIRVLTLTGRLRHSGVRSVLRNQLRKIAGRGPRLGVSRIEALAALIASVALPLALLILIVRMLRRAG